MMMTTYQNMILVTGELQVHLPAKTVIQRTIQLLLRLQAKKIPRDLQHQVHVPGLTQDLILNVAHGQVLNLALMLVQDLDLTLDLNPLTLTTVQETDPDIVP